MLLTPALDGSSTSTSPPSSPVARPWTPPDIDSEDRSLLAYTPGFTTSNGFESRWPGLSAAPSRLPTMNRRTKSTPSAMGLSQYSEWHDDADSSPFRSNPRPTSSDSAPHEAHTERSQPRLASVSRMAGDSPFDFDLDGKSDHFRKDSIMDPFTPTKKPAAPSQNNHNDIPQYPYTPDSSRMARSFRLESLEPLPRMPWDEDQVPSPVQDALQSCLSHLQNLIETQQPEDEQIEYLVSKFEEMTQYLSAPAARSRQPDDHLFAGPETFVKQSGLGIAGMDTPLDMSIAEIKRQRREDDDADESASAAEDVDPGAQASAQRSIASKKDTSNVEESSELDGSKVSSSGSKEKADELTTGANYILEVDNFIEGVKKSTEDLKTRLQEVSQLNSIQMEIIHDLRQELARRPSPVGSEHDRNSPSKSEVGPSAKGFWTSVWDAVDAVTEVLHD